jgi:hypothetical protein
MSGLSIMLECVEPILDPLSAMVPCTGANSGKFTHLVVAPITFKYYMEIKVSLRSDCVWRQYLIVYMSP